MLAYVFYHRPRAGVSRERYERALIRFHDAIARVPPPGFRGSAAFRLPHVTWGVRPDRPLYVDWYVLSAFADLDPVREVANRPPWVLWHRGVAALSGDGWGSLYATPFPADAPSPPSVVAWFSSPPGRGRALVRRWNAEGPPHGVLWRRQLALGPSPEYCYIGRGAPPVALASPTAVLVPDYLPIPSPALAGSR